ncbi:MAG: hypothetical protein U5K69_03235 [Balneolaceae bacterium]|nr:hypothetical protein [Balneolaceae bacterium]
MEADKQLALTGQQARGEVPEGVSGFLGHPLNALAQNLRGGQFFHSQGFRKEAVASELRGRIKVGLAHADQANHRPGNIAI